MAFPQSILDIETMIMLGGTWTDVSDYVYAREDNGITITYGRDDEGALTDPSSCSFEIDNRDGRFSTKNPNSPYYGLLKRNTPIRVAVLTGSPYLALPGTDNSRMTTPDAAALDITGDIDVRADVELTNWYGHGDSGTNTLEIIGKAQSGNFSWFFGVRNDHLYFEWSADGTNTFSSTATALAPIPSSGRLAIRVTLDVDNGASGSTTTFYTSTSLAGSWTQLGSAVVRSGTTSIFNSTAALNIGDSTNFVFATPEGKVFGAQVLNGIDGSAVANPDFTIQSVGATSFADAAGRTWSTNGVAEITNRNVRFYGRVTSWPVRWQTGGLDVHCEPVGAGPLRQIGQGEAPLHSAVYREFTNPARTDILAYWPCEEGSDAQQFTSPTEGVNPGTFTGEVSLASLDTYGPSAALPVVDNGVISFPVPNYTVTGETAVRFFAQVGTTAVAAERAACVLETTGTAAKFILWVNNNFDYDFRSYDADGTQVSSTGFVEYYNSNPTSVNLQLVQNGANIDVAIAVFNLANPVIGINDGLPAITFTASFNAQTVGRVKKIRVGGNGDLSSLAVGHFAISAETTAYSNTGAALVGHRGERPTARFRRLSMEEDTPFEIFYNSSDSEAAGILMGNQGEATLLGLFRTAEAVSQGVLYEERRSSALVLRDNSHLENQTPALTLSYTGSSGLVMPIEPVEDDQRLFNDVTVERTSGSKARVTQDTGPLNTQSPEDDDEGVGRYDTSVTLDLWKDDQNEQHAGWLLYLGTWDEPRWPKLTLLLQKVPGSVSTVTSINIGDVIQINNTPSWLPPGGVKLMVQGYTEFISQYRWEFVFNCSPASPWYTGLASDSVYGRADTEASVLNEALTTTETDVDVTTTAGVEWITTADFPSDFPFDVQHGGEVSTVTAITSAIVDTFTRSVTDGWGSPTTGPAWTNTGGAAADYDVNGTRGLHANPAVSVGHHSVDSTGARTDVDIYGSLTATALSTGGSQFAGILARFTDANNLYEARVEMTTAAAVLLTVRKRVASVETQLATFTSTVTHVAATLIRVRFKIVGSTLMAKVWLASGTEPPGWQITTTDTSLTSGAVGYKSVRAAANTNASAEFQFDNFETKNPQTFTVTRSVNGVVKAHSAGTSISLAHPTYTSL